MQTLKYNKKGHLNAEVYKEYTEMEKETHTEKKNVTKREIKDDIMRKLED